MINDLKPYPFYKDSGVPWLRSVPEHWNVLSLKRLGLFKGGVGFPLEHQGHRNLEAPFFKVSDMNLPGNSKVMTMWNNAVSRSTAASLGATIFPSGTILFPKVGGALLTNKRRIVERPCCIDNNLMGCVIRRGNPSFVLLVLQYLDFATIAKPGPVPAISEGEVREIKTAFPSLQEQAAIVRFLDYMDRRIGRYIRAKQKLIKLLEEQKQAVIHRAVTRGLDPNVRLKPTGVKWLGDVPEHWDVKRCRYLFRELDWRSADGSEEHLSMSQRLGLVPSHLVENRTLVSESHAGGKLCEVGDLVLNRLKAHLGVFALSHYAGVISSDYTVLRHIECGSAEYYEQVLRSPACRIELRIRGWSQGSSATPMMVRPEVLHGKVHEIDAVGAGGVESAFVMGLELPADCAGAGSFALDVVS